jgi:GNAT superfamily N-acetyltransferase
MERRTAAPRGITIRPIGPADHDALAAFYGELSEESLWSRFHGVAHGISDGAATVFCGPDHEHREGFVALARGRRGAAPVIVGHLCLEPAGADEVELAVAVADRWQGRGVGRALLRAAIAWARCHDVTRLQASMLTTNSAILGLLRSARLPTRLSKPQAGVVTATMELTPALCTAA